MAGKQITITLPEYTYAQLNKLAGKKNVKKSVIITLALEHYERAEEKEQKGGGNESK